MDVSVGCTSFMVCKKDTTSAYPIPLGASNGQTIGWYNNGKVYIGGSPYPAVNLANTTDWVVLAVSVSGTSPYTLKLWKDSTYIGSVNSSIADITLTSAFARSSPLSLNNNEYAELLHYNTPLSDSDVVSVSNYLKTIHGIS